MPPHGVEVGAGGIRDGEGERALVAREELLLVVAYAQDCVFGVGGEGYEIRLWGWLYWVSFLFSLLVGRNGGLTVH